MTGGARRLKQKRRSDRFGSGSEPPRQRSRSSKVVNVDETVRNGDVPYCAFSFIVGFLFRLRLLPFDHLLFCSLFRPFDSFLDCFASIFVNRRGSSAAAAATTTTAAGK